MRFMIHGADQKTGRELTVVVDAPDETEAERRALYNDILVSSVARFTAGMAPLNPVQPAAPTLSYRPPEIPAEHRGDSPPSALGVTPKYRDVLRGARWLDSLGTLSRWGGGLVMLSGVALILIVLIDPLRELLNFPVQPALWMTVATIILVVGMLCVCCGVMVSMMSGLVIAIRDIAQNTFHVAARRSDADAQEQAPEEHLAPMPAMHVMVSPAQVSRVRSLPVEAPSRELTSV
jgi:hypothetical protein